MTKRKELTDSGRRLNEADDYKMTFVLLDRDAAAPFAIRAWIEERIRLGKNKAGDRQLVEAESCARWMERHG